MTTRGRCTILRGVRWCFSIIAVGSMVVLRTPSVGAQGSPQAARLFEEGRALAQQGKYEEACERYSKSYELERAAGTMLNLGDCAERAGQFRRAWLLYDAAARDYEQAGKARPAKFARDRADALAPKLATIVVRLAEPRAEGLTVRIGGRAVPPAPVIVERLDAGAVAIEVGAPGRAPFQTTANAESGAQAVVEVPALRAEQRAAEVPPPPPKDQQQVRSRRQRSRVVASAAVGGAGVLALGASAVFAWRAVVAYRAFEAKERELGCDGVVCSTEDQVLLDGYFDKAALRADLATGFVIGGAVLAAGGAVLFFTAPRERVTISPLAAPGTVGLAAAIRF